MSERCRLCGKRYDTVWLAPDAMFDAVNGSSTGTLCPACFDAEALALGFSPYWTCLDGRFADGVPR